MPFTARYAPALAEPAGTVLVGIIAAAPYQRQDAFKGKVGFTLQKLQTMYRIHRPTGTHCTLTGQTGLRGESFAELTVHMEHIAGTHDIAFADFNRGRMAHRPGRFGGGAARGKGIGGTEGGAGGGGQQKSGTVKTTRNLLLLRAILLTAMGCFTPEIGW